MQRQGCLRNISMPVGRYCPSVPKSEGTEDRTGANGATLSSCGGGHRGNSAIGHRGPLLDDRSIQRCPHGCVRLYSRRRSLSSFACRDPLLPVKLLGFATGPGRLALNPVPVCLLWAVGDGQDARQAVGRGDIDIFRDRQLIQRCLGRRSWFPCRPSCEALRSCSSRPEGCTPPGFSAQTVTVWPSERMWAGIMRSTSSSVGP